MERIAFPKALAAGLLALVALGQARPAAAQLGHVVKAQKISSTSGGFSALLEEMDQFGRAIVNLGDFDGDGVSDLLVGAHTDDDGGLDKGCVYVLFMHSSGFVKEWRKISDLEGNFSGRLRKGDQFGRAAACLGDLDGDGVTDVAVSANYDDDDGANKGAVYILFLNADGTVKSSQKISALQGNLPARLSLHDEFGRSITNLGDMDGDGVVDLLVGTPEDDEGGTNTGALHVLFLNTDGTVKGYNRISKYGDGLAIKPTDWFGFCSASLGDFDGDGVTDVVVGSVLDDDGGVNQGSIWILCLNPDGSVKTKQEIDELEGGLTAAMDDIDQFGTAVVNLGDLDGDGVTDIAVGAVKDDDGGTPGFADADVGAVYVLFLNPDATVKSWVKVSDVAGDMPYALDQWDWFGSALAPYGGSPGDGLFNLVAGCRNDDDAGGNQGAIYMLQLNDGTVPSASFTASKSRGLTPMTVDFTDTSVGEVTAWLWNLGEDPLSTQQNPTKTYTSPGTFDVQLTTRGPGGIDAETRRGFVTARDGILAGFDATPRTGPCPLAVTFTDRSEGPVTSWSWDFGDGTTSSEPAPTHVYADCGSYTVALTVTGPPGTDTLSENAYVVAALLPPEAVFTAAPTSGEAPLDVQFRDASTGQVTSWFWDFGDGEGSTVPSPLHTYETDGLFSVSLTVHGPGGTDIQGEVDLVSVGMAAPVAAFGATPTLGPAPLTVVFGDQTTGAVSGWGWDFGDGATSTEQNPVHVYAAPGPYSVTLTASGPGGSNALTRTGLVTVEIAPPGAAFNATPTAGPAPLAVQFSDLSTNGPTGWSWDFGDGATSSEQSPVHAYATPGLYAVTLVVSGPGGSDILTLADLITVDVAPTLAGFTFDPESGPAPLAVSFSDASSANVSAWSWSFGDGATSSLQDPVHVYSVPGTYSVTLSVQSPTGADASTGIVAVYDALPQASFAAAPSSGLAPLAVQFEDRSTGIVTAWSWDFGDGQGASVPAPAHVFALPGLYTVALTVTGPRGASTFTAPDAILVGEPPPVADFGADLAAGPPPLSVQFRDLSTGVVTAWSWDFGDGASSVEREPVHVYSSDGAYDVTLTVTGPGGTHAVTRAGFVQVSAPPPVADFMATPRDGWAPLLVTFQDLSAGAVTQWSWDFGDGQVSSEREPEHTFAAGTHAVSLAVTGPGGTSGRRRTLIARQAPLFADRSFEQQSPGARPVAPWTVYNGTSVLARSSSKSADNGFPFDGVNWCDIGAEGTASARPPSNPRGPGQAATGTAGIQQAFQYPAATPHLFFRAAFLLNGPRSSAWRNDFMSVDVSDGTTVWNLYYADSFSALPLFSSRTGLAMTMPERVHVDLSALFPDADENTVLTLRVGTGNVGGSVAPSRGYVDDFRLGPVPKTTSLSGASEIPSPSKPRRR